MISAERQEGAFLYHLAVENKSASRYTAVRLIQDGFPEVSGNLKVKFEKSWGHLCDFLTSGDREMIEVWGRYTRDQIVEIAALKKKKKGGPFVAVNEEVDWNPMVHDPPPGMYIYMIK